MGRFSARSSLLGVTAVGLLLLSSVGTPGLVAGAPITHSPHGVPPAAPARGSLRVEPSRSAPHAIEPVPGKVYAPFVTPLPGDVQQSSVAVDPTTGTVYAIAREGGFLTESNLSTGELLASSILDPNPVPGLAAWVGLCLAPSVGRLFISFQSTGGGSVWVVGAGSLSLISVVGFPSYPSFEPQAIVCDPASGMVAVQSAADGSVILVNSSTYATSAPLSPCGTVCLAEGLIDVPAYGYIVALGGRNSTRVIVPALGTLGPALYSPSPLFGMGPGTYDAADNALWIANASAGAPADVELFDAPGRSFLSSVRAPGPVSAITYAAGKDAMILADAPPSASSDRLDWFNASSGSLLLNDSSSHPAGPASLQVVALAFGVLAGVGYLLAADSGSTELFELAPLGPPEFLFLHALPSVPTQYAIATDATDGAVFLLESATGDPASSGSLVALNGSTGNLSWSLGLTGFSSATGALAVDPALEELFVAQTSGRVAVVDATNGSLLPPILSPNGTRGVTFDPVTGILDILAQPRYSNLTNVSVYAISAAGALSLGGFQISALPVCAWTADPLEAALAVVGCQGPPADNVAAWYSERNGTRIGAAPTVSSPWGVTADVNGNLYVASPATGNVTVIDPSSSVTRSVRSGLVAPEFLAIDPTTQLLFASGPYSTEVSIVSLASGNTVATLPLPSSAGDLAVNPSTGELVVATSLTGQRLFAPLLAPPSQVVGESAVPSNGTVAVAWTAASGTMGYPVTNYSVKLSISGPAGPWTVGANVNGTSVNLTGLVDGTPYLITVAASAETGTGLASAPVRATPAGAPYPPNGLSVTAGSSTSLNLSWGSPASSGGLNLTGFVVGWALDAIGPWVNVSEPASPRSASIGGLDPSTGYFVRVSAVNALGAGNPSPSIAVSTPATPGPAPTRSPVIGVTDIAALVAGAAALAVLALYLYRRKGPRPPR
jgi:fibronectin type III domain protein